MSPISGHNYSEDEAFQFSLRHELRWSESVDRETGYRSEGWMCKCGFTTEDADEADAHVGIRLTHPEGKPWPQT